MTSDHCPPPPQVNYRPRVLVKGAPTSLYSQLPDTSEIQFAREMTDMQSEVNKPLSRPWDDLCSEVKGHSAAYVWIRSEEISM